MTTVVLALLMAAPLTLGLGAPPASAAISVNRDAEVRFTRILNSVRFNNLQKNRLRQEAFIRATARAHARNMAAKGFFDHRGFSARVERIQNRVDGVTRACENLAFASGFTNANQVAKLFFDGWRESVGHRRCMFSLQGWRGVYHGIGIVRDGDRWWGTLIVTDGR